MITKIAVRVFLCLDWKLLFGGSFYLFFVALKNFHLSKENIYIKAIFGEKNVLI